MQLQSGGHSVGSFELLVLSTYKGYMLSMTCEHVLLMDQCTVVARRRVMARKY